MCKLKSLLHVTSTLPWHLQVFMSIFLMDMQCLVFSLDQNVINHLSSVTVHMDGHFIKQSLAICPLSDVLPLKHHVLRLHQLRRSLWPAIAFCCCVKYRQHEIHRFNHFKVSNSMVLRAFTMLCKHHHYLVPGRFHNDVILGKKSKPRQTGTPTRSSGSFNQHKVQGGDLSMGCCGDGDPHLLAEQVFPTACQRMSPSGVCLCPILSRSRRE